MSYQYDDKINRELAKTAMAIYINDNTPGAAQNLNETKEIQKQQQLNEAAYAPVQYPRTDEAITNVLLEYVTDTCLLAEQNIGRRMGEQEITAFSQYILENIESMGQNAQVRLVTELLEQASNTGADFGGGGGGGAPAGVPLRGANTGTGRNEAGAGSLVSGDYAADYSALINRLRDDKNFGDKEFMEAFEALLAHYGA
jgi:hypothetical protein